MEFEVLGPLRVRAGTDQAPLTAQMPRTLLGILLSRANTRVPVDVLVDGLWGGRPDPGAGKKLQLHVHRLRRALGEPDRIRFENSGYTLRVDPGELDVERFETLLAEAADAAACGEPACGVELYRKALGLWRGEPYSDLADVPLLRAEADRLAERRLTTLEELYAAELAGGRAAVVVPELAELAAAHPLRERLQELLMLALYRAGRQADALGVYRRTRHVLVEELGVEPGPQLKRLERAILRADPALEPAGEPPPAASVRPAQLPADITDFTGREAQLATLRRHLTVVGKRPATVVISAIAGRAGVGKTSLAVHTAHQLREEFPDGQLYVNLRGAEANPLEPAEVLARFLRALGVVGTAIPEDLEERAAMYRSLLADRRMLVVLDNAATEAQLRPLLPGAAGCAVLVTSRARLAGLDGVRLVDLDVLTPEQAVDLLDRITGAQRVAAEPQAGMEIARRCGYLPLAVRIAGARLAARPHWPLARLAASLADEHRRLDELRLADLEVRASLALSYEGLDPTTRRAFRRLGLLDAADFASWTTAALLDVAIDQAEEVLDTLVDAQLLEVAQPGYPRQTRYLLHDLVRLYAREQAHAQDCAVQRSAALARLACACLTLTEQANRALFGAASWIAHGDNPRGCPGPEVIEELLDDTSGWFETERSNLVAMVKQGAAADLGEIVWQLADSLLYFVHQRGQVHLPGQVGYWQDSHQAALAAARRADDRRGEGALLLGLALLDMFQRRFEEAGGLLEQAHTVFAQLGDRHGAALVTFGFGVAHALTGHFEQALRSFHTALTTFRELADLPGQATADFSIGRVYLEQGRLDDARTHFDAAVQLFRRVGHRSGEATALDWLGQVHNRQERLDQAASCFRQCQLIADQSGEEIMRTRALLGLAGIDTKRGRHHRAEARFQRCLDISRQLGHRSGEALALDGLGGLYLEQARNEAAIDCLTRSVEILQDTPAPSSLANTLRRLGEAHAAAGNREAAEAAWHQARELVRQLDAAEADHVASPPRYGPGATHDSQGQGPKHQH